MQLRLAAAFTCFLVALPTYAQSKTEEKNTDRAQVVSTAEITKVDAKKKTLQVKELLPPVSNGRRRPEDGETRGGRGTTGGSGGTTGGGGRRRSGGVGFPGSGRGGGTGRLPGGPGSGGGAPQQAKQYKVFVTKDTVMKLAETNIEFGDLHVGDRVTVSGFPKGSKGDVEAATITRTF